MRCRLLVSLPLCLLVAPGYPARDGLLPPPPTVKDLKDEGGDLPDARKMERLAKEDPLQFLEACIRRYDREVKGYEATLIKQERVKGKLLPREEIRVWFRDKPFSTLMKWPKDPRPAQATLYVKGENGDLMLALPTGLAALTGPISIDPKGTLAMQTARYPITESDMKAGMVSSRAYWIAARDKKALHVEYLGVKKIFELGDRPCYVLKRKPYARPEADGITEAVFYFDQETWMQTGSILKNAEGELIGEYFFRDVKLNPKFPKDLFTKKSLK
jgi:hypothetical protein